MYLVVDPFVGLPDLEKQNKTKDIQLNVTQINMKVLGT